jgi:hypothetical protein
MADFISLHHEERVKREQYKNFYKSLAKAIEVLAQEDMAKNT